MGSGSLHFIRFIKNVNCSNHCYMNITWVAIEFIPYNLIIVNMMNIRAD